MPRRPIEHDSSDSEGEGKEPSKQSVTPFYKSLYKIGSGSSRRKEIQGEANEIQNVIDNFKEVEATRVVLEAFEQRGPVKQPKIAEQYRFAMLDQAVHPDEFRKILRIALFSYSEVKIFSEKDSTNEDIRGYILIWKRDCERLIKLLHQINKDPKQVAAEVKNALPELEKRAQRTLDRLEQIPDWQAKVARLGEQARKKLQLSRDLIKTYLGVDASDVAEGIKIEDYIGNDSTKGPRFCAELDYRTRDLAKRIDGIIEPANLQWQGSPERTVKEVVRKVPEIINNPEIIYNRLGTHKISDANALERVIYHDLCANKHEQLDFSIQPSDEEYEHSIQSIAFPLHMEKVESLGYLFFTSRDRHSKDYKKIGRFLVNIHPDAMIEGDKDVNGKTKEMMETVIQLDCVYIAKVVNDVEGAVSRLDPVVIFVDMADSRNKDIVAECLRPYAQFTRPDLPVGTERIHNGIGYANESVVKKDSSWTHMITESIAKVAWELKDKSRPITFETLWPRVESDLRVKGIIEI